jgi:hypothetical protein
VELEAVSLAGLRGVPPSSSFMSRSEQGQASGHYGRTKAIEPGSSIAIGLLSSPNSLFFFGGPRV